MESSNSAGRSARFESVVTEFDSFDELLSRCASKISEEGLIVESDSAAGLSSILRFELKIRDGFSVLTGDGEVVAARELDGESGPRYEMALRFVHLDNPSLKLLPRLIEHYRKQGITRRELPSSAAGIVDAVQEETDTPMPLTLADLEMEFSSREGATEEPEMMTPPVDEDPSVIDDSEDRLLDAEPALSVPEEIVEAAEVSEPTEVSEPPEVSEPAEVIVPTASEGEIRVDDLMPVEETESDVLTTPAEFEGPPEDPGLPWLPDESEIKKRSDLWWIVIVAIAGALLGAGFYFLYLNDSSESQGRVTPVESSADPERAVESDTLESRWASAWRVMANGSGSNRVISLDESDRWIDSQPFRS